MIMVRKSNKSGLSDKQNLRRYANFNSILPAVAGFSVLFFIFFCAYSIAAEEKSGQEKAVSGAVSASLSSGDFILDEGKDPGTGDGSGTGGISSPASNSSNTPDQQEEKVLSKKEQKRLQKISKYIDNSRKLLGRNKFRAAYFFAGKALQLDEDNEEAKKLLAQIKQKKREDKEKRSAKKQRSGKRERKQPVVDGDKPQKISVSEDQAKRIHAKHRERGEKRKEVRQAFRESVRREAEERHRQKKVNAYLVKSGKCLSRGDYSAARSFAYKARGISPESGEVAELITEIEKKTIFEAEEKRETVKTFSKEKEENPLYKYDEGKSWMELVSGMFMGKDVGPKEDEISENKTYTIDDCVHLAIRRSQRMVVADRQVALAETRLWETRRELLPSVTGKFEQSFGKASDAGVMRHYVGKKIKVEMKYNIFDGMGVWFKLRQSQTNREIVKLEREKRLNEVVEETRKAYYNLDKTIKAFDVQDKLKKIVNRLYDIVEKAHQQELVAPVEYLKVKGQNAQANFQQISAAEDIALAELVLFQAMAMEPDQRIKIAPVKGPEQPLSIGLENCYMLAMANRPDFKIKEKTIEYYEFERKMMKAKGWPKIDFHGSYGRSQENYNPLEEDEAKRGLRPEWFAGFKGSWPLWGSTFEYNYVKEKWAPGYASYKESIGSETATSYYNLKLLDNMAYFSELEEAKVGFETAKYEYIKARKDLTVEVKSAYFKYRKALLQMDVAEAKVEHQKMFVDVVEERRRYGEMEVSKTIEEYEKLAADKYSLVHGRASYFIALTELNKAIGIPKYFGHENKETKSDIYAEKPEFTSEEKKASRYKNSEKDMLERAEAIARYLQKAEKKLDEGNFDAARDNVRKALIIDKRSHGARILLERIEQEEKG